MRIVRPALAVLCIGALTVLAPMMVAPSGAQTCATVVDETGQLDVAEVEAAASMVVDADARVAIFNSVPNGDLEAAADELIAACYSDGPDGRQLDLVLVAVSLGDRMTTVQFGGAHNVELGPTSASIQSEVINPRLAAGDITAAMVDGLGAIDDALSGEGAQSSDSSGPAAIVGLVVAALVALAGVGLLIGRRRQLNDDRNEFEAALQQPLVDVGVARERIGQLRGRTDVWAQTVTGRTKDRLLELRADSISAVTELDGATANFTRATQGGVGSLSRDGLSEAKLRLQVLQSTTTVAQKSMDRLQQFGDRIERLRVTMPVKREAIEADIDASLDLADQRESEGWQVDTQRASLMSVDERLAALDLDELAIDTLAAEATIEDGEASLFAARHDLQTLPDRKAGLEEWARELRANLDAERSRAEEMSQQLRSLESHHAQDSIARAGTIENVLARAASSEQDRVIAEQQIASQAWEAAAANLESSGLWLIRADDLLDHMDDLVVSMETARSEAPGLLDQIAVEIRELSEFIERHDRELPDQFDVAPERAAMVYDGLRAELALDRPNHLRVAEAGSTLARQIDEVFLAAREEHARVVALKREVGRELARAWREVERAKKTIGWQLFGSGDARDLDALERELAGVSGSLEDQLEAAVRVRTHAARLRADVIAKRRRNAGWVMAGSGGGGGRRRSRGFGGGGFGGGMGGGGFSGGGGSFGGGGSSSSW